MIRGMGSIGYYDYPNRTNYPKAGTPDEAEYIEGWNKADREERFVSDKDWPLGRDSWVCEYRK